MWTRRSAVFLVAGTVALLVGGFSAWAVSRQATLGGEEGITIDLSSAEVIASDVVPGGEVSFITYNSSRGRCLDIVIEHAAEQGTIGGCGGDGTSLASSGVGVGGVSLGNTDFAIIHGRLDAMAINFVEADMPDGTTVRMYPDANGIFYYVMPGLNGEDPRAFPVEFRAVGDAGEVLDVLAGPPPPTEEPAVERASD